MWNVIHCKDCNNRQYLYGNKWDEEDYYCNHCTSENYEIINNRNEFISEDIAIILGNELEDGNYHDFANMPENLLNILKKSEINENKCKIIMNEFSEMIWEEL